MMDPARWDRLETIFDEALGRPTEARNAYLDDVCEGDADLRAELELMLREHDADPEFLNEPIGNVHDWAEESDALEGTSIGSYRIVKPLGTGGMGRVYRAVHEGEGFEHTVALKVIRRGMDTDEILRRFRLERRMLARLNHPNIAQLIDGGATEDGRPFFVMEFVDGIPIDEYCESRGLSTEGRLRLFRSVCEAVQHAHVNLVVHRDLKPSNILVGPEGVPKLLDFGIGKLTAPDEDGADARTRTGIKMLTPEYAAPEQILGEPVNVATDVYGLGLLLYQLLTRTHPYAAKTRTADELEEAVLRSEPPRPSSVVDTQHRRALAGDLDVIVLKALRAEPERRYASAAALSDDIARHLEGRPVRARPDTLRYRTAKFVRRNAMPLSAATVVFLALASATAYATTQSRRVAVERDKALEVQGFLLEMFGAAAPDVEGNPLTARALLDQQAETLDRTYRNDPLLRASMMAVLAEGYDRLGLFEDAEPLAESALTLRREGLPDDHPDVASSVSLLGWLRFQAGDTRAGETLLREALAIRRGSDDPAGLSRTLNDLGVVREAQGDYDEAGALYDEALELRRAHFGEGHRAFATTASNRSVIHYRQGDYEEAYRVANEALDAMRAAVGPDHQRSIVIQNNLAAFAVSRGDIEEALAQYEDLLVRQTRLQGPEHPVTLGVRRAMATTWIRQGRVEDTEREFRDVLRILDARYGPEHRDGFALLNQLGTLLFRQQRFDEAVEMQRRAVRTAATSFGDRSIQVADAELRLADTRDRLGQPQESIALRASAVDILDELRGPEDSRTAAARSALALRHLAFGDPAEAFDAYAASVPVLERSWDPDSGAIHTVRLRYAHAALVSGRPEEAETLLARARDRFEDGGVTERHEAVADSLATAIREQGAE